MAKQSCGVRFVSLGGVASVGSGSTAVGQKGNRRPMRDEADCVLPAT